MRKFAESLRSDRHAASQPRGESRPAKATNPAAAPLQAGKPQSAPASGERAFARNVNFEDDAAPADAAKPAAAKPDRRVAQATPPQDPPARPATRRPPQRQPAQPAQPAERPAPPAVQDQPADPATTNPAEGVVSSVSGTLRGDVLATPVDSGKIIITGDERNVNFIIQMLKLMEASAEQPDMRVFPLETAKATVLAPIIEQIMQASIEQTVGTPGAATG